MDVRDELKKRFSPKVMPTSQALVYFQASYYQMLRLIGLVATSNGIIDDNRIASAYAYLQETVTVIISRKDFARFKKSYVPLFKHLSHDTEGMLDEWEMVRGKAADFLSMIEKEIFLSGIKTEPIDAQYAKFLSDIDKLFNKLSILRDELYFGTKKSIPKVQLASAEVSFDDKHATLHIGDHLILLRLNSNEHKLCRSLFMEGRSADTPIPYIDVLNEFYSDDPERAKEESRTIYHTVRDLNKKIAKQIELDKPLFQNRNEHLIRHA